MVNREIDLSTLKTKIYLGKNVIDWENNIGNYVKFKYDEIEGIIYIEKYNRNKNRLTIKYNNILFEIHISSFKKCCLGKLLNKRTVDFKYKIGQHIKDDKRDITIINRKYIKCKTSNQNKKYYKYKCNKCGFDGGKHWSNKDKCYKDEFWIYENNLLNLSNGCACCSRASKIVVKGINDIATTNTELVKYFVNIEDAYINNISTKNKVLMKCPNCGEIKNIMLNKLKNNGFSCPKCSDGISYPEKIMYNLLKLLNVDFITQYNKKHSEWCNKYKYDFYFKYNEEEYIIETHGQQHYKENSNFKMTLKEIQTNDKNKKELAINNGIKPQNYIAIDCRKSELGFIKNNIINSKLGNIFDLANVDWIKIGQDSEKSLVKEVCDYWYVHNNLNNEGLTTGYLTKYFNKNKHTIIKYLKHGTELNWCNYNPKEWTSNK